MTKVKIGELSSWDEAAVSGASDFMKLEEGNNKIRVVTNPYQFIVHWAEDASGQNRKLKCAINNCPLCKRGVPTQARWYLGVLDYKTGKPKILEIGSQVYSGIRSYAVSEEWDERIKKPWGNIFAFDFIISRGPKGTNPLYQVQASPKMKDITKDETEMIATFLETVDIGKFTEPLTPEAINEKLGFSEGEATVSIEGKSVKLGSGQPEVSEEEFNFEDDDLEE